MDIDIRRKLPFDDNVADFIFAEHVIEHVSHRESYEFFVECRRVLKNGGVLRIATPSVVQIARGTTPGYLRFLKDHGWGDGSPASAVRSIIFEHGHASIWSAETLLAVLDSIGFKSKQCQVKCSEFEDLRGIEGHDRVIGAEFNALETLCVEAQK